MKNKLRYAFLFISAGLVFSGFLSAVKLFTDTCAFNESCPYFLGYPACWYGFGMYLIMFVITAFALLNKLSIASAVKVNLGVSFAGILFAGRFFVDELMQSKATGELGLSTCAYGLAFYVLIFIVSLLSLQKTKTIQNL